MRTKIFILSLLNVLYANGQEFIFSIDPFHLSINFEDSSEYKYFSIDTNNLWFIAKPQKDILFIPSTLPLLGEKAIISDTNLYYGKNLRSSFHFKFYLESSFNYSIFARYKFDFDKNKDGGIIETSYDNGETWTNILFDDRIVNSNDFRLYGIFYDKKDTIISYNNQPGFTGLCSGMEHFEIYFEYWEPINDTIILRFTFSSDSIDSHNEGWLLDDIRFDKSWDCKINDPASTSPDIKIFPNPASGIIYLISESEEIDQIQILSLTGTILYQEYKKDMIKINHLNPGIYFMKVNNRFLNKIAIY